MEKLGTTVQTKSKDFPAGIFSQKVYFPKNHHHIEYEIFYLDRGEVLFGIEGAEFKITQDSAIFLEPETEHFCKAYKKNKEYHYFALVFDISIFGDEDDFYRIFFKSLKINRFITLPRSILEKLKICAELKKSESFGCDFFLKSLVFESVSYLIQTKQFSQVSTLSERSVHSISAVDSAVSYIKENYKRNISLDDVLSVTNYTKSHFCRIFQKNTGISVTEYLNKFRIEKSCLDLIYTDKNITEIALDNGFNNIQYFSRVFKQFMNCTPKQYQKKTRGVIVPSAIKNNIL